MNNLNGVWGTINKSYFAAEGLRINTVQFCSVTVDRGCAGACVSSGDPTIYPNFTCIECTNILFQKMLFTNKLYSKLNIHCIPHVYYYYCASSQFNWGDYCCYRNTWMGSSQCQHYPHPCAAHHSPCPSFSEDWPSSLWEDSVHWRWLQKVWALSIAVVALPGKMLDVMFPRWWQMPMMIWWSC